MRAVRSTGEGEVAATLVTHRFPLEEAPRAFATAADRAGGAIKDVIDIESEGHPWPRTASSTSA
jgi:threonine dehydrogenase-like Zn-dependent dehydrogenase